MCADNRWSDVRSGHLCRRALGRSDAPAHRSHLDYLLLLKLLIERDLAPPTVAAGQNLAFFPLSWIMRTCYAFFIRRSQGLDGLYGAVLSAYLTQLHQLRLLDGHVPGGGALGQAPRGLEGRGKRP